MIALQVADQKDFTGKLFRQETFDGFCLAEAEFLTRYTITLDGFLTEPEENSRYVGWGAVRPLAFQILKGKELPHSFRITLRLSDENTARTLAASGLDVAPEEVGGLLINIHFDGKNITIVTGCSLRTFSLDRSLEQEWDRVVRRFFRHHEIPVEEM